jgi:coenzyme F420-dependent glucose-6-phosphate dehydrogenase
MEFAWLCSHESYQPEELVEQAVVAEAAGFDIILGADHFHPWVDDSSAAGFVWSWLGAVAMRTEHVRIGTSVTCPLFRYHPGIIAQAASTVDRLSGGRLFLGLGTGEAINERPLGFDFPSYDERQARMREAMEIIQRLLSAEKLSYQGQYYTTETARLYSPPLGQVRVLMAAGGPKSADLAGRHADGIITSVKQPGETLEKVIKPYLRVASQRLASPTILATRWVILANDADEAWRALAPLRGLRAPDRLEATDPADLRAKADAMNRTDVLRNYTTVSDAAGLFDAFRPLVTEVGADIVSIQVASTDPLSTIRLIGRDVLPRLRALT